MPHALTKAPSLLREVSKETPISRTEDQDNMCRKMAIKEGGGENKGGMSTEIAGCGKYMVSTTMKEKIYN